MLPKEREPLVLDNLDYVHYLLQKYLHIKIYDREYEDYYQEGCVGLIVAAIRFDESKGFKFSTYAAQTILGTVKRYRREKVNLIKIPRNNYDKAMEILNLASQGLDITEIKERTKSSYYEIQKALSMINFSSLDYTVVDDAELHEIVPDDYDAYEELLAQNHILECIPRVSSKLKSEKKKNIWEEYIWSLMYGESLTNMYFANKYSIAQSYVSRILIECKKLLDNELSK